MHRAFAKWISSETGINYPVQSFSKAIKEFLAEVEGDGRCVFRNQYYGKVSDTELYIGLKHKETFIEGADEATGASSLDKPSLAASVDTETHVSIELASISAAASISAHAQVATVKDL